MPKFKPKKETKIVLPGSFFVSKLRSKLSFLKWIDPFTYVDLFVMPHVKRITTSASIEFIVNVFFALLFAWVIYFLLGLILQTATPLVIVYSASMENTFFRGDVMALSKVSDSDNFGGTIFLDRTLSNAPVSSFASVTYESDQLKSIIFSDDSTSQEFFPDKSGEVVVYSAYPSGLPIIHRSIVKIVALDGNFVLTKGDNSATNKTFDEDCGNILPGLEIPQKQCITLYPIRVSKLQGKAFFGVPLVGCVKLWLIDDLFSLIFSGKLPRDFKGIC
jgi:signal peptidase I